jgi:hypothetical protein
MGNTPKRQRSAEVVTGEVVEAPAPVVLRPTGKTPETVHLFSIVEENEDGEEVEKKYYARKEVGFNETLRAGKIYSERGEEAALMYSLERLVGTEGFEALMNYEELDQELFEEICEFASKVVMGPSKSNPFTTERKRSRG